MSLLVYLAVPLFLPAPPMAYETTDFGVLFTALGVVAVLTSVASLLPASGRDPAAAEMRELFHFAHLRGAPNGHFAYRRIALKAYEIAKEVYPAFAPFMRWESYPSSAEIEHEFFARTA